MSEKKMTPAQERDMKAAAFDRIRDALGADDCDIEMAAAIVVNLIRADDVTAIVIVDKEVISNIACVVMHENMNDFSTVGGPEEQTLNDMEFAIELKRALTAGRKRIALDMSGPEDWAV